MTTKDRRGKSSRGISKGRILEAVNSVLLGGKTISDVGLIFVSREKMRQLNRKYRRRDRPTNVLSFETGEVVLCPEVVRREAKRYGFAQKNWMTRLIVHGILHLAGYDHDTAGQRRLMEGLENKILEKLEFGTKS